MGNNNVIPETASSRKCIRTRQSRSRRKRNKECREKKSRSNSGSIMVLLVFRSHSKTDTQVSMPKSVHLTPFLETKMSNTYGRYTSCPCFSAAIAVNHIHKLTHQITDHPHHQFAKLDVNSSVYHHLSASKSSMLPLPLLNLSTSAANASLSRST